MSFTIDLVTVVDLRTIFSSERKFFFFFRLILRHKNCSGSGGRVLLNKRTILNF